MPNINLRLTDQEHAELTEWAFQGRRSIQKEIIWRLFSVEVPKYGGGDLPTTGPRTEMVQSDKCLAYAPRGTKCKLCGQVHK